MPGNEHSSRAGTRHRDEAEVEFARLVAFSDGVFAIAITLLVLNLEIPKTPDQLAELFSGSSADFLAYAISFAVLGRVWLAHHAFFSDIERFDRRLMVLNLLYLAWVTLVPFATGVFGELDAEPEAIAIYAGTIAALGATAALMRIYALHHGLEYEAAAARERVGHLSVWRFALPIFFLASIPVAYVEPAIAPWMWVGSFFIGRFRPTRDGDD